MKPPNPSDTLRKARFEENKVEPRSSSQAPKSFSTNLAGASRVTPDMISKKKMDAIDSYNMRKAPRNIESFGLENVSG